ncbi:hypothetical protein PYCC9005_004377 [Savitreella phatthalungensis]
MARSQAALRACAVSTISLATIQVIHSRRSIRLDHTSSTTNRPGEPRATPAGDRDAKNVLEEFVSLDWLTSRIQGTGINMRVLTDFKPPSLDELADKLDLRDAWSEVIRKVGLPEYAQHIPTLALRLKQSFSFEEGSMGDAVAKEMFDQTINHHCNETAEVRFSNRLCRDEQEFFRRRAEHSRQAFAKFVGVPAEEVDIRDVPIVGIAGSGGGLRACLATASYYDIFQRIGLWDCTHYLAGVSGSTWAQALVSTLAGGDPKRLFQHLEKRTTIHIADPANLRCLMDSPADKYILRDLLERRKAGFEDFGLVGLYGLLLASRFMLPSNEVKLNDRHMTVSAQRDAIDDGRTGPMSIYTLVRHEIPPKTQKEIETGQIEGRLNADEAKEKVEEHAYFQFFEMTPYEFGSEELGAWIPTWSLGRRFEGGRSIDSTPEIKLTTLLGTFSSAFCASLQHYYRELQPILPKSSVFDMIDDQIKQHEDAMSSTHLIDATKVPNLIKGVEKSALPKTAPSHMTQDDNLELCDAGMSNNIPFYSLLRRDCDVLIAIDSSADIDETGKVWFSETESYAKRRGLKAWPVGAGWPRDSDDAETQLKRATAKDSAGGDDMLERSKDTAVHQNGKKQYALDSVNIWVGQSTEATASADDEASTGSSRAQLIDSDDMDAVSSSSGMLLVYLPLLPHAEIDIDPTSSEVLSTWNFKYTPEDCRALRQLCEYNFFKSPGGSGEKRLRRAMKAIWQRKRAERLKAENH